MNDFPTFMKNPLNRIASSSQYTDDIEGYVFDGADESQVAFWTCPKDRVSKDHAHDFDEYVLVVEGRCTVIIERQRTELLAGDEFLVPKGTRQSMEVAAVTRTIHVFGGKRARESKRGSGHTWKHSVSTPGTLSARWCRNDQRTPPARSDHERPQGLGADRDGEEALPDGGHRPQGLGSCSSDRLGRVG